MSTATIGRPTKAESKNGKEQTQPRTEETPSNSNGQYQPAVADATDADIPKDLERLHQIELIGHDVKKTRTKLTRQMTEEAKAESALKEERAKTRKIVKMLDELLTDLSTLAAGGSLERLPFGEKSADAKPVVAADDNAWRNVPLAELEIGKAKVVNRLIDAGVTNFGQLEDWRASRNTKPEIKGMGEAAMQAVEDAVVAYWAKHPRAATPAAPAGLVWQELSETQHFAETASGIKDGDGKSTPLFVVMLADGVWTVDQSRGVLMPDAAPPTFATVAEARTWCQRREDELRATEKPAEVKALEWIDDGDAIYATNTAGIETEDADIAADFVVSPGAGEGWMIDESEDTLLATQFPESFETIDKAKAYCEERNRELCLHAREQMPEAFAGKPAEFDEDAPITDPKDIDLSAKEMFAVDQLDALARMGEKPKRIKHVSPLLGEGFLGVEKAGHYPCVVLGTTLVRGQECLRLGLLSRADEWAKQNPTPVTGKAARERVTSGTFTGILVIACNVQQIIGDIFHVRVGKAVQS